MHSIRVYKCLCDESRLRILNLLALGPLCVCHLMEIMECDQVRMSKQLRYLKQLGMVSGERKAQWRVYRLSDPVPPLLEENLRCLQDCAAERKVFRADLKRRSEVIRRIRNENTEGAEAVLTGRGSCRC